MSLLPIVVLTILNFLIYKGIHKYDESSLMTTMMMIFLKFTKEYISMMTTMMIILMNLQRNT